MQTFLLQFYENCKKLVIFLFEKFTMRTPPEYTELPEDDYTTF